MASRIAFSLALPLTHRQVSSPPSALKPFPSVRAPVSRRVATACATPDAAASATPDASASATPAPAATVDGFTIPAADDPRWAGPPWGMPDFTAAPAEDFGTCGVEVADAMDFFRAREGGWASWRVTHHLAFRRSESGESSIQMTVLAADDERIVELLKDNEVPLDAAVGGCYVTWKATMAWDQEGENHEGSTVFALVPEEGDERRGRIIRDRGYAEIVPIAGKYYLDAEDALCLDTPYDGGAVEERFFFDGPDLLHRVSTVRRFGGLSSATFATETRVTNSDGSPVEDVDDVDLTEEELEVILSGELNLFGGRAVDPSSPNTDGISADGAARQGSFLGAASAKRMADSAAAARASSTARPSPGSAFGTGFSSAPPERKASEISKAEAKAGIDLSKVPPSMRADFEKSLGADGPGDEPSSS